MLFICYSKCSTCKKAQQWLDSHDLKYELRDIKENNPTYKELEKWIPMSKLPTKRFWNTSGLSYRALNLKDKLPTMSLDEQIKLLSKDGMLVKRPIIVKDDLVFVGFNEENWSSKLL